MMHSNRYHAVGNYQDAQEMATKMVGTTWTLCSAFAYAPEGEPILIFANDSTSEDAVAEYGVFYKDGNVWRQFESYTVGWVEDTAEFAAVIRGYAGEIKEYGKPKDDFNFGVYEHDFEGRDHHCRLCA